jgi:hypothetical protein
MNSIPSEQQHFNASREYQAYYDSYLRNVGGRAPEPTLGQTVNDYRRETCRMFKRTFLPQNHELYQVNYRGLQADALPVYEKQLLEASVQHATNPQTLGVLPGEYKPVKTHNPYTGAVDAIKFIGHWDPATRSEDSFVKYMGRPGRLARIRNPTTDPGWFPKEIPSVFVKSQWPRAVA